MDKIWAATKPLFVTQYNKEQRKLERESKCTPYKSNASFREITAPAPQSIAQETSDKAAYEAAIEYAQALEEQTKSQAAEILALKSMGGTNTTVVSDFAASAVAAPSTASADLNALQTMVAQLATIVATLSKNNRCGDERCSHTDAGRGGGKMDVHPKATTTAARRTCGIQNDPPKGTSKCPNCSLFVYHKPEKCYELEANKANCPSTWKSVKDR